MLRKEYLSEQLAAAADTFGDGDGAGSGFRGNGGGRGNRVDRSGEDHAVDQAGRTKITEYP